MKKLCLADPAFLVDQNAVHHRDLTRRPAEGEERDPQPGWQRSANRQFRLENGGGRPPPRPSRLGRSQRPPERLPKIIIEVIENRATSRNPLIVSALWARDTRDHRLDTACLLAAKLAVLEVDVVDDLADGGERRIGKISPCKEDLEAATVAFM